MAAPIAHIVCGLAFLASPYCPIQDKQAFIVGTSFPDIRYIGHLHREQTHWPDITITDVIEEPNPFLAGMKFHSWVDETREQFVLDHALYDHFSNSPFRPTILKFFEDTQLYNKVNWTEIIPYFDTIQKEELTFGVPLETITQWHKMLQAYFSLPPTVESIQNTLAQNPISFVDKLYYWSIHKIKSYRLKKQLTFDLKKLDNNRYVKERINYFYTHIEHFF